MKTQIELARGGIVSDQMQAVADDEKIDVQILRQRVASGQIVIPSNPFRKMQQVVGIGRGLRTKINASIGTSSDICDIDLEVRKAIAAEQEGADTLMELSAGGDLDAVRLAVLERDHPSGGQCALYTRLSRKPFVKPAIRPSWILNFSSTSSSDNWPTA